MILPYEALSGQLAQLGINILVPDTSKGYNCQTPRDIGFVIDDTFVVASMAKPVRQGEIETIDYLVNDILANNRLHIPDTVTVEGGDIIYDKGIIYVGLGQRTNQEGLAYMQQLFPNHTVVGVPLTTLKDDTTEKVDTLHLDCAFMPVGQQYALLFEPGIPHIPEEITDTYEIIPVHNEDQRQHQFINLASNVLSLSPELVIADQSSPALNERITQKGIDVIELSLWESQKVGGSYRCGTLPLYRD
jgi:N-dimethylarginine dimethylaminohydrolase